MAKKQKYTKICPKCGSDEIHTDFSNPVVWDMGTPSQYKCHRCGRVSLFFPEVIQKEKKSFQKKIKENKVKLHDSLIDTQTGYSAGIIEITLLLILVLIFMVVQLRMIAMIIVLVLLFLLFAHLKGRKQ